MLVYYGLEEWLKSKGLSITDFAKMTGTKPSYWTGILGRTAGASLSAVDMMCRATGLSIKELVKWYPDKQKDFRKVYRENDVKFDRLMKLVEESGKDKYEIALSARLNRDAILRIQAGTKPRVETVKKLADYFGVLPTDLFEVVRKKKTE